MPEAVKVQSRIARGYEVFLVTIPKKLAGKLGIKKGDILFVETGEYKGKEALIYYKP
ncbi:MAG: AbrB/MazE/SpoVT family DNA-binding domain-containing protein [Candidatus Nezhaarchaeales archaeon]